MRRFLPETFSHRLYWEAFTACTSRTLRALNIWVHQRTCRIRLVKAPLPLTAKRGMDQHQHSPWSKFRQAAGCTHIEVHIPVPQIKYKKRTKTHPCISPFIHGVPRSTDQRIRWKKWAFYCWSPQNHAEETISRELFTLTHTRPLTGKSSKKIASYFPSVARAVCQNPSTTTTPGRVAAQPLRRERTTGSGSMMVCDLGENSWMRSAE